ncbi:PEP-CTERM system TPR-repeat protein PrsT [Catenovulum sp. 2E275]|uniref:XrtA/PEP-CTERM system TPR-repeat protein PrsT n=1 Tax=Catenovulum sp. 2E275 TaxID=2980497 RepID=UPI0021CF71F1|nr:XrtA/PEP-CTERM system TPR-repeat protein PrsT [Catenovulum sp. 2E275]MCU4675563.1 PEP-CTERM system TPR-repeat protein PrsT [Catenovulum sp. 2E275]
MTVFCGVFFISACLDLTTFEDHINNSQTALEQGDTQTAVIELKNAISKAPQDVQARVLLGSIYFQQGLFSEANKEFERALSNGKVEDEVKVYFAKSLYYTESYQQSLNVLEQVDFTHLSLEQQSLAKYYNYLNLFALKEIEAAQNIIIESKPESMPEPYSSLFTMLQLLADNKIDKATQYSESHYSLGSDNAEFLQVFARLHALKGNYQNVAKAFEQLNKIIPKYEIYQLSLIDAQIKNQDFSSAEKNLTPLLKQFPNHAYLNLYKAMIRYQQKDCDNAKTFAEKAIQAGVSNPASRLIAGVCAFRMKNMEQSYQHLAVLNERMQLSPELKRLYSAVQLELGYNTSAVESLMSLDKVSISDASLFIEAGIRAEKSGDEKTAQSMLDKLSDLDGLSTEQLTRLGMLEFSVEKSIDKLEAAAMQADAPDESKFALAAAYLENKEYSKALNFAQKWIESDKSSVGALNIAGYSAEKLGNYKQAQIYFEQSLVLKEGNSLALIFLAQRALDSGNNDAAQTHLDDLIKFNPNYTKSYLYYYKGMSQLGKSAQALDKIKNIYSSQPDNQLIKSLYIRLLYAEQNYDVLIKTLDTQESKKKPLQADELSLLAHSYLNIKAYKKAEEFFIKWNEIAPDNKESWFKLVLFYEHIRAYDKGLSIVKKALSRFDNDFRFKIYLIEFLLKNKITANVDKYISELKAFDPEFVALDRFSGELAILEGKFSVAVKYFKNYYDKKQDESSALSYYQSLRLNQQVALAFNHLEQFLTANPKSLTVWLIYANDQMQDDQNKAFEAYRKILNFAPNHVISNNNFAWLLNQRGQYKSALEYIEKAIELAPQSPVVIDTYANILMANQKLEAAEKQIENAYQLAPTHSDIVFSYLTIKNATGNKPSILEAVEQVENSDISDEPQIAELLKKLKQSLTD